MTTVTKPPPRLDLVPGTKVSAMAGTLESALLSAPRPMATLRLTASLPSLLAFVCDCQLAECHRLVRMLMRAYYEPEHIAVIDCLLDLQHRQANKSVDMCNRRTCSGADCLSPFVSGAPADDCLRLLGMLFVPIFQSD